MKILLISSSPRKEKSQTFNLAKEVLRASARNKDVELQILHLCDLKIEFCRHCEACHKNILACPIKDDVGLILKKMLEADAIILASPNYINQITASMKALFDRSSHFIHCRRLEGKYIAGVACSGSGYDTKVLDYLRYYGIVCAAQYTGGVSSKAPISEEAKQEAYKLGNKLVWDIKEKTEYSKQIEMINKGKEYFRQIIKARKDDWKQEYEYWLDKGWLR